VFVLNAKEERVLRHLAELGLSNYEGKAYFGSLVLGRAKAWDLARYSTVPQSRIYNVIERLQEKGLVEMQGKPVYVEPVPLRELASRMVKYRQEQIRKTRKAEQELESLVRTLSPIVKESGNKHMRLFKPRYRR